LANHLDTTGEVGQKITAEAQREVHCSAGLLGTPTSDRPMVTLIGFVEDADGDRDLDAARDGDRLHASQRELFLVNLPGEPALTLFGGPWI
jgi:hypothetical protein